MDDNIMVELGRLHLHRPRPDATPAQVRAWHLEHAAALEHLGRTDDANAARTHAAQLTEVSR
ncbi:MAG TPA: hypothetical protein VFG87_23880 [Amycolatopsis sp.]|jgi:hypothetical protein|nr:hypothetical protein [Amycolatopsis sp.]